MTGSRSSPFTSVRVAERRRWRTAVRVAVGVLVATVVLGALSGVFSVAYGATKLSGTAVAGLERSDGTVTNTLVVVVPTAGAEADGIALVQTAEARDRPAVLVLPTNLRVAVLGEGTRPLAAYHGDGAIPLLVDAVSEYTDLPLHHYVEIRTDALAEAVDRLGGVPECPAAPVEVCPTLVGAQVAERFAPPAEGAVSGPDRVLAIASVLDAVAAAAREVNPVLSPLTTRRLVDGLAAAVRTDVGLGPLPARRVAELVGPAPDVRVVPGLVDGGLVSAEPEQTAVLLQALADVTPWPDGAGTEAPRAPQPSEVRVRVLNGTGQAGAASSVARILEAAGFEVVETGNADPFDPNAITTVQHGPGAGLLAQLVVEALGVGVAEERGEAPQGAEVVVVVGTDGPDR
ncbi:MAG: LCP family protein [Actinomycetes bacterium]